MLEGRFVKVFSIGELKFFATSMPNQGKWNEKEDKGSANSTCVSNKFLWILFK
jgi:hypothetical protein